MVAPPQTLAHAAAAAADDDDDDDDEGHDHHYHHDHWSLCDLIQSVDNVKAVCFTNIYGLTSLSYQNCSFVSRSLNIICVCIPSVGMVNMGYF